MHEPHYCSIETSVRVDPQIVSPQILLEHVPIPTNRQNDLESQEEEMRQSTVARMAEALQAVNLPLGQNAPLVVKKTPESLAQQYVETTVAIEVAINVLRLLYHPRRQSTNISTRHS